MITINNSIFDAQGASVKDKVYGITLNGNEDIEISKCTFLNKGYSSILNNSTGKVTVDKCVFQCGSVYNPIEGSQINDNDDVVIRDCVFSGVPGNNYINFYQMKDGSSHEISGCSFTPAPDKNNVIRISNRNSAKASFLVKDCEYVFGDGEVGEYTGFLLCQDYTNKSGVKQDFTGITVTLDNVKCDGTKLVKDGAQKGSVYYVYDDAKGIITGENDPVVIIK